MVSRERAEKFARHFHETYGSLAPLYGWVSDTTRLSWDELPAKNRNLMVATAMHLLEQGYVWYAD